MDEKHMINYNHGRKKIGGITKKTRVLFFIY